ncbi:hypothetical protein T06_14826 [Trichinella sp. T6]|nr:hypothetical protein T06_14826 [Trichinella sp. T6]
MRARARTMRTQRRIDCYRRVRGPVFRVRRALRSPESAIVRWTVAACAIILRRKVNRRPCRSSRRNGTANWPPAPRTNRR